MRTPARYVSDSSVKRHSILVGPGAKNFVCLTVALTRRLNVLSCSSSHVKIGKLGRGGFLRVLAIFNHVPEVLERGNKLTKEWSSGLNPICTVHESHERACDGRRIHRG